MLEELLTQSLKFDILQKIHEILKSMRKFGSGPPKWIEPRGNSFMTTLDKFDIHIEYSESDGFVIRVIQEDVVQCEISLLELMTTNISGRNYYGNSVNLFTEILEEIPILAERVPLKQLKTSLESISLKYY